MDSFFQIVLLFFCYSFIGWLWETCYVSLKEGHFVYRGFLFGPITPIYGFAILGVLFFLEPLKDGWVFLFIGAVFICSMVEYLTSYLLEKFFHATWWNYENVPLNIHGRVALPISIFWGVCCVLIVKVVQPFLQEKVLIFYQWTGKTVAILLMAVTLMDLGFTLSNMLNFKKLVLHFDETLQKRKAEVRRELLTVKENLPLGEKQINQLIEKRLKIQGLLQKGEEFSFNFHQKRWIKNFSKLRFNDRKITREELRQFITELGKKNK